ACAMRLPVPAQAEGAAYPRGRMGAGAARSDAGRRTPLPRRHAMLRTTVTLAVCSFVPSLPAPRPAQDELASRLRAVAGAFCEEESIGAMTVAVHLGGDRVFAGAFGAAADAGAAFRAGALGDALIATAVLELVDQEELALETPVAELLPGF